jgi:hypothetical protein
MWFVTGFGAWGTAICTMAIIFDALITAGIFVKLIKDKKLSRFDSVEALQVAYHLILHSIALVSIPYIHSLGLANGLDIRSSLVCDVIEEASDLHYLDDGHHHPQHEWPLRRTAPFLHLLQPSPRRISTAIYSW